MKLLLYVTAFFLFLSTSVYAADYNYISPVKMKENIEANRDILIVDIQVEQEFKQHHIPGSIATHAYPVKSDEDKAKLDQAVEEYNATGKPIVIVCPRGAGGAKRGYDYLKSHSVPEEKLAILEKGMSGWPYKDMTAGE